MGSDKSLRFSHLRNKLLELNDVVKHAQIHLGPRNGTFAIFYWSVYAVLISI